MQHYGLYGIIINTTNVTILSSIVFTMTHSFCALPRVRNIVYDNSISNKEVFGYIISCKKQSIL